ncbi:right-handed parallel beta-helix repeat-containing protein [Rathayibacter oskolensis]|uniref:right-handed parallel beta-helix repeat-containing protein n=1 Tax=Rathayibacter oskolensis TaxID=1891671 RepID=UPI00265DDEEA|nr:right-handed parallel beta-helix repeat-containing protein [Rathayibacter oskolensis]WKK71460.1 right-handed parallel beta-helix repeat-containing protein [Rathayibacter oskolensis]
MRSRESPATACGSKGQRWTSRSAESLRASLNAAADGTKSKTTYTNIQIRNVTVESQFGYPIRIENASNVTVDNCHLFCSGSPVPKANVQVRYGKFVKIINNYVHDAGGNGINIHGIDYFVVSGNQVFNTVDDGIDIDYDFNNPSPSEHSRYGVVSNNTVDTVSVNGNCIRVENSDYVNVVGNQVQNAITCGIWVGSDYRVTGQVTSNILVSGNIVSNCDKVGIRTQITNEVASYVEDIFIVGNTVTNCGSDAGTDVRGGIVASAPTLTVNGRTVIRGNKVRGVAKTANSGAVVIHKTNNIVVSGNTIDEAPYGIHLWNGDTLQTYTNVIISQNEIRSSVADYFGAGSALGQTGVAINTMTDPLTIRPKVDSNALLRVLQAGGNTVLVVDSTNNRVGIGTNVLTHRLNINGSLLLGASTSALASLRVPPGVAPTSPVNGDMWNDGAHVLVQLGGVTYQLDQQATAPLDATTTTKGVVQLAGDLGGQQPLPLLRQQST